MFKRVEDSNPDRITIAIGAWISLKQETEETASQN